MGLDDELRVTAEQQHGLVSWQQARDLGASAKALRTRARSPDWELLTQRVLRLVGAPRSARQLLMATALDGGPGTVASHRAAAALWRLPGFPFGWLESSRERGRTSRRPSLGHLRLPLMLPPHHTTAVDGIPVTTLPRTLFDLAAVVSPARLERVVDTVVSKSPGVLVVLHALLDELAEHGRNGIAAMRAILAERPPGYVAPASGLEARFMDILAGAGLPPMERQLDVGGHDWIGRVDFADRELRLIVEVDSALHHSSTLDRENDRRRDAELTAAGWRQVLRISDDLIWHRPSEVAAVVAASRARLATDAA
jgi:very-short-patch-repair endonuclease